MKAAAAAEELEEAKRGIARLGGRVEKTETYDIDGAPRCVIVIRKERPTTPGLSPPLCKDQAVTAVI